MDVASPNDAIQWSTLSPIMPEIMPEIFIINSSHVWILSWFYCFPLILVSDSLRRDHHSFVPTAFTNNRSNRIFQMILWFKLNLMFLKLETQSFSWLSDRISGSEFQFSPRLTWKLLENQKINKILMIILSWRTRNQEERIFGTLFILFCCL